MQAVAAISRRDDQRARSSERYWMASATCSVAMASAPARSAMVRATRRSRSCAESTGLASVHAGVRVGGGAREAGHLPRARREHSIADRGRDLAGVASHELGRGQGGNLEVQVDPVQEWTREATEVTRALGRRA